MKETTCAVKGERKDTLTAELCVKAMTRKELVWRLEAVSYRIRTTYFRIRDQFY